MKKELAGVLCLCIAGLMIFSGCDQQSKPPIEPTETTYTVTFKQEGFDDIVKSVKSGETLSDIPVPQTEKGYAVSWESKDFSNICENLIVLAVRVANKYTVTYETGLTSGVVITAKTQEVTYNQWVDYYTPTHTDYVFDGWVLKDEKTEIEDGVYTFDHNITLVAEWKEDPNEKYPFI